MIKKWFKRFIIVFGCMLFAFLFGMICNYISKIPVFGTPVAVSLFLAGIVASYFALFEYMVTPKEDR